MAVNLEQQLESVRAKSLVVSEKYQRLREAFEAQKTELTDLRAQLLAKDEELEKLRLQVEYLSIASTVSLTADDLAATRAMVADLVREIDRCLADLTD
ncbi:MAG: hypothetical protein K2M19_09180 [Muribaculaceae bacterium]|nr:hypothetical protein [Muribaculaceae bacterium]